MSGWIFLYQDVLVPSLFALGGSCGSFTKNVPFLLFFINNMKNKNLST